MSHDVGMKGAGVQYVGRRVAQRSRGIAKLKETSVILLAVDISIRCCLKMRYLVY